MPSLSSRRQHPAWIFLSAIRQLRGLAIPLIVVLVSGGNRENGWFLAFSAGLILLGAASRTLAWWQFRYEVTEGELRVSSGLLARRERFVPLARIQAVDINETPLQRLLGVVRVRIETAASGSAGSEVTMAALSRSEAELLRDRLASGRGGVTPGPVTTPPGPADAAPPAGETVDQGVLIRRLSGGELLAAGATSGRIAPALAAVSFAFQFGNDVIPESLWERLAMSAPGWSLRGLITLVGFGAVAAWLLAILSTVLTFAGFALRRDGDRLLVTYGLLERRHRSIPLGRIQAVTISEGLLRQPFGLASVRFESAGYGKDTPEWGILFPLVRRAEVPALLAAACPAFAASLDPAGLSPPPPRARRRYALGRVWPILILTAVAVAIAALLPSLRWWWGLAPLATVTFAALNGLLGFRDTGWAIDATDRLIARTGGVERRTAIIPRRRIQHRSVAQNPLQRRATLASFAVSVASGGHGGTVLLPFLDEHEAFDLLDRLGPPRPHTTLPARPEQLRAVGE